MMTPYVTGAQPSRQVASQGTRPPFTITQLSIRSPLKLKLPQIGPRNKARQSNMIVQDLRLESEESKGSRSHQNSQASIERQMFQKYAIAWYECALAHQSNGSYAKSIEAYQNSITLNSKLQNKTHLNFLFGDYYLCLLQLRRH
jgi:hypothetical protein